MLPAECCPRLPSRGDQLQAGTHGAHPGAGTLHAALPRHVACTACTACTGDGARARACLQPHADQPWVTEEEQQGRRTCSRTQTPVSTLAVPRSPILSSPFAPTSTLAGLMSRWMMELLRGGGGNGGVQHRRWGLAEEK